MTDPCFPPRPQDVLSPQPASESAATPTGYTAPSATDEIAVDYVIKCICGSEDADQNTVCCEKCESWQHTECYYMNADGHMLSNDELEHVDHFCVDCQPRHLDVKGATDRQKARQEEIFELSEKRVRKTTSKSHKKKPKITDAANVMHNGWSQATDVDGTFEVASRNAREPLSSGKKSKPGHRSSHSRNHPSMTQQPHSQFHRRSGSSIHSPTKTSNAYSPRCDPGSCNSAFVHLYDHDPGDTLLETNLFNDTLITSDLSRWSNDVEALARATPKFSHPQIFKITQAPVDSMDRPHLRKEEKIAENVLIDGQNPRWKYLKIDTFSPSGAFIGEVKGKIGHMRDYTQNVDNEWERLRHPKPFVFFHPRLPIYIDTRSEGTACRYLRRSCMPNLKMETFLENGSEYHFCWVASSDIEPGSELTIGWTLDENARRFLSDGGDHDDYMTNWTTQVFPDFGGCACNSTQCSFARFSRNLQTKTEDSDLRTVSATHIAPQVHGRAGSDAQEESRSPSGSKFASRDNTPTDRDAQDTGFGTEISAREKRKIAAMEKNFEQLENEKAPVKKKKRTSGGSSVHTPGGPAPGHLNNTGTSHNQSNNVESSNCHKPQNTDTAAYRAKSRSPPNATLNTAFTRLQTHTFAGDSQEVSLSELPVISNIEHPPLFVDKGTQTNDTEENEWYSVSPAPSAIKKPYLSLTKRLLLRSQHERQIFDQRRRTSTETVRPRSNDVSAAATDLLSSCTLNMQIDADVREVGAQQTPITNQFSSNGLAALSHQTNNGLIEEDPLPPPPPQPWSIAHQSRQLNNNYPADLHVQVPSKITETSMQTPTLDTPTSALLGSPTATNAFSLSHSQLLIQPSPVTKKLSLSEYFSKRKGSSNAHDKITSSSPEMSHTLLKPSASISSDDRAPMHEESAILDSPKKEPSDPIYNGGAPDEAV